MKLRFEFDLDLDDRAALDRMATEQDTSGAEIVRRLVLRGIAAWGADGNSESEELDDV